jgi:hypothetical protein
MLDARLLQVPMLGLCNWVGRRGQRAYLRKIYAVASPALNTTPRQLKRHISIGERDKGRTTQVKRVCGE